MLQVIGVGLPRTGTRSLVEALRLLGYTAEHEAITRSNREELETEVEHGPVLNELTNNLEAVTEAIWWRPLVERNEYANIILTIRDEEKWWESICAHIDRLHTSARLTTTEIARVQKIHCLLFGSPWPSRGLYLERYKYHIEHVILYCRANKRNLLLFDVSTGWGPLCNFLKEEVPQNIPFPWFNRLVTPEKKGNPN